jgi:hypothetical protein
MDKTYFPEKILKRDLEFQILNTMYLNVKFKRSLRYVLNNLPNQKLKDFEKITWYERKNDSWCAVVDGELSLLIRQYHTHFTIFSYVKNEDDFKDPAVFDKFKRGYGCFTFYVDTRKSGNSDFHVQNNFFELNKHIKGIISTLKEDKIHLLWNDAFLPRPEYVEIKNVWDGGSDISDIDDFIFAMEEISGLHLMLFSENDVFNYLGNYKAGDKIGDYTVTEVQTKLEDDYYHNVGISTVDKYGKEEFNDVYKITRWFLKDFVKE